MNKSPARVTVQLLRRRARALDRHLPAAAAGDHHGVHQARVATRRLRELVPILTAEGSARPAAKASRKLRRLTRALGTVRELDVTLQLLDEFVRDESLSRIALEEVRAHVVAARERRRTIMLERLDSVDAAKLGRRLAAMSEALADGVGAEEERWRGLLAARLVTRAARLRRAIEDAGPLYDPERLHEVRLSAKKFRYSLELAAESGVEEAAPHARVVKRVQEVLGRLNDLHVLQGHVAAVQADGERPAGRRDALAALASRIEEEARHVHGRYVSLSPGLLESCGAARTAIVPRLERRARRLLKMQMVSGGLRAGRDR